MKADGLAGRRRPIVTKRGPMVHGIQFYISRVLKDKKRREIKKIIIKKKRIY